MDALERINSYQFPFGFDQGHFAVTGNLDYLSLLHVRSPSTC